MAFSNRTKTAIASTLIAPEDDLYPDRSLTDRSITTGTPIPRLPDTVPRTSVDMSKAYQWEHGDTLYGTFAKESPGMKAYRDDIDRAWGTEDDYKPFYVDTTKPVAEQLEKR